MFSFGRPSPPHILMLPHALYRVRGDELIDRCMPYIGYTSSHPLQRLIGRRTPGVRRTRLAFAKSAEPHGWIRLTGSPAQIVRTIFEKMYWQLSLSCRVSPPIKSGGMQCLLCPSLRGTTIPLSVELRFFCTMPRTRCSPRPTFSKILENYTQCREKNGAVLYAPGPPRSHGEPACSTASFANPTPAYGNPVREGHQLGASLSRAWEEQERENRQGRREVKQAKKQTDRKRKPQALSPAGQSDLGGAATRFSRGTGGAAVGEVPGGGQPYDAEQELDHAHRPRVLQRGFVEEVHGGQFEVLAHGIRNGSTFPVTGSTKTRGKSTLHYLCICTCTFFNNNNDFDDSNQQQRKQTNNNGNKNQNDDDDGDDDGKQQQPRTEKLQKQHHIVFIILSKILLHELA